MAKKKTNPEPEMEQGMLSKEFEPVKNDRVHRAAKRYYDLMLERKAAGDAENDSHDSLLNTMLEEGLEHYEYKGLSVAVDIKKSCKVKVKEKESVKNGKPEAVPVPE